ncbi:cysteine-rich motor neuron 1 protein-like, partial [Clarias magur]
MDRKCLLLCQLLAFLLVEQSLALSCLPCYKAQCPTDLNCLGGKAQSVCGCCLVCAKVKNEECGGPYDVYGTCDEGLVCVRRGWDMFNSPGVCR